LPAHATLSALLRYFNPRPYRRPMCSLDKSRDIRPITLMPIVVHLEPRHLSFKLPRDLEPHESAGQIPCTRLDHSHLRCPDAVYYTTSGVSIGAMRSCCARMGVARSERPIRHSHLSSQSRPPAYTMLTRPSAAHEDLPTCPCPLAGTQVPCAIFDRLALHAYLETLPRIIFHATTTTLAVPHRCRLQWRRRARGCSR
jgi:hypothetical protein